MKCLSLINEIYKSKAQHELVMFFRVHILNLRSLNNLHQKRKKKFGVTIGNGIKSDTVALHFD